MEFGAHLGGALVYKVQNVEGITEHPAGLLQAGCGAQERVPQLAKVLTHVHLAPLIRHRDVPECIARLKGEEERVRRLARCQELAIVVD
jgi:hypothetical protein